MEIFVLRSDGAYGSFRGMSQQQITTLLVGLGLTCSFIDEATYIAAVSPK